MAGFRGNFKNLGISAVAGTVLGWVVLLDTGLVHRQGVGWTVLCVGVVLACVGLTWVWVTLTR
jgi:hypothetical protein